MPSKHPAPMLITPENRLPIHTIVETLQQHVQVLEDRASVARDLLEWAKKKQELFDWELNGQPQLAVEVYRWVKGYAVVHHVPVRTDQVVRGMELHGSPTGVRGNLSRLVRSGFLLRPERGTYWPADVLFHKNGRIDQ